MNIEPDIFDYLETTLLEPHDDYTSEISYKDQKIIWNRLKIQQNEIERLNNIIYREISDYILKKYGMLDDTHYHDFLNELELKESGNNE